MDCANIMPPGKVTRDSHFRESRRVLNWRSGHVGQRYCKEFPGISLDDIHTALTYYFDKRAEVEEDFRYDEQWADWVTANVPSKKSRQSRGKSVG